MKQKKCRYCKDLFSPYNSLQPFCFKDSCIKEHNQKAREKKANKLKKDFNENDKSTLLKLAQMTFNKYIRLRDAKINKCISCDYEWEKDGHQRQQHASHFYSTSKSRLLRFNEDNVHMSCQQCNTYLSGNLNEYKPRLIKKIGLDRFKQLEKLSSNSEPCRYTTEDYKNIISTYKQKIKDLS